MDKAFARIEGALAKRGDGPFLNGERYGLVDAGYAPFLQRWTMVEAVSGKAQTRAYSRLRQWAGALIARPSTHSFAPGEFRALYLAALAKRGGIILETSAPAA